MQILLSLAFLLTSTITLAAAPPQPTSDRWISYEKKNPFTKEKSVHAEVKSEESEDGNVGFIGVSCFTNDNSLQATFSSTSFQFSGRTGLLEYLVDESSGQLSLEVNGTLRGLFIDNKSDNFSALRPLLVKFMGGDEVLMRYSNSRRDATEVLYYTLDDSQVAIQRVLRACRP